ncbi:hypothetical protein U0E10_08135 [Burkholderia ubonensis]|nr:hypothetical protein [Burkholderia ubonensis]
MCVFPPCRAGLARSRVRARVIGRAGTGDDYTPIAPCRAYVDRLKAAGRDVSLTEYPGARHVFDGRAFNPPLTLPKAQTLRHCRLAENDLGQVINADTRQPFSYADARASSAARPSATTKRPRPTRGRPSRRSSRKRSSRHAPMKNAPAHKANRGQRNNHHLKRDAQGC